ncbi:MAG: hypothetical protein AAGH74_02070 [Pseudomonadota bacterium]
MARLLPKYALGAMIAALALPAVAEPIAIAMRNAGITNDDYKLMTDASASLYEADTVVVGAETLWSNTETGAFGTVEIAEFDGTCVTMTHLVQVKKTGKNSQLNTRRCKADDGRWLITPIE